MSGCCPADKDGFFSTGPLAASWDSEYSSFSCETLGIPRLSVLISLRTFVIYGGKIDSSRETSKFSETERVIERLLERSGLDVLLSADMSLFSKKILLSSALLLLDPPGL